jgi:hypothetical protein
VSVPADRLAGDDTRYAVVGVNNALRVLVVDGEPTPDAYDDEAALLVTALRPEGEVFSGIEPVVVEEAALDSASLAEFQAVVLANVYRLSEPFVEELERFVRHGGGLIVFCGDQVDLDWYNTSLVRDGDGLLAARLEEAMRPAAPVHLETTDRFHPVMRTIDIEGDPLGLRRVGFRQYVRRATEDGPGAEGGAGSPRRVPRPPTCMSSRASRAGQPHSSSASSATGAWCCARRPRTRNGTIGRTTRRTSR